MKKYLTLHEELTRVKKIMGITESILSNNYFAGTVDVNMVSGSLNASSNVILGSMLFQHH